MSKESFIGGDYIETTGGSSKTYAKGTIELSGSKIINNGKANGVSLGMNGKVPEISTEPAVTKAYFAKIVDKYYRQINWAGVEDEVYVVVRTMGLIGKTIEINIIDRDAVLVNKEYTSVSLLQDNVNKKGLFTAKVDDDNLAIFKLELKPSKEEKDIKSWRDKINKTKDKLANLCILVDAEKQNAGIDVKYFGKNPDGETSSKKGNKTNYWLDEKGKWFQLRNCECSAYSIDKDILTGPNVTQTKTNSKVKGNSGIKDIIAIVLHRTIGSSIAGAIAHSKGTHFYVEGSRGVDGEIFQPIKLNQYSNHIMNKTARTSHLEVQTENSIGIEVIGMAYYKIGNDLYTVYDTKVSSPDSVKLTKAFKGQRNISGKWVNADIYWDQLTTAQIKAVKCLVITLMKKYNLTKENIFTHEQIQSKTAGEGEVVKDTILPLLNECT